MTVISKKQHEKDQEKQRKLETSHYHKCYNCEEIVCDQEGFYLRGWYCDKDCAAEHIEHLRYRVQQLEQ